MSFVVTTARSLPARAKLTGLAVGPDDDLDALEVGASAAWLKARGFEGEPGQVQVLPAQQGRTVVLLGVGRVESGDRREVLTRAAAALAKQAKGAGHVATDLPTFGGPDDQEGAVRAVVEGFGLGDYRFTTFKGKGSKGKGNNSTASDVERLTIVGGGSGARAQRAAELGRAVVDAVALARDLVNEPGGSLTPPEFAARARAMARTSGLRAEVWGRKEIAARKLGGVLGVNRGSEQSPAFVKLTYTPKGRATGHLALVGKGITFDAGGLSIKTGQGMMTMKSDMGGAAAVIGAMSALRAVDARAKVTAFVPMTDNMLGGDATRPGDVLTIRNGKTVEVLNTDAEGRLILADALVLASEAKPDAIVDLATLTGACVVALGSRIAGLMGTDDDLVSQVKDAADRGGERLWELPLPADYAKPLESQIADLRNIGSGPYGGAMVAGLFLKEFVAGETPWAHIDIAGPAFADAADGEHPKGGTGFGVRSLIELARTFTRPDS
jgi:leucyl aminopeptidase